MAIRYTKWQLHRPNGHKICQHLSLRDTTKFTQNGIFGVKIYHLATLVEPLNYTNYRATDVCTVNRQ
jgi:hypothetical protein